MYSNWIKKAPWFLAIESKYGHRFYEIFQQTGTKLYFAAEKSKYSGGSRPFELTFLDTSHNVMMTMLRKDSHMLCCCGAKCFGNVICNSKRLNLYFES